VELFHQGPWCFLLGGFWKGGEIMGISLKGSHVVVFFLLNENGYDMEMM